MFDKKKLLDKTQEALMELINSGDIVDGSIKKTVVEKPQMPEDGKGLLEVLKMLGMKGEIDPHASKEEDLLRLAKDELAEEEGLKEPDELEPHEDDLAGKRKKSIMLAVMKK